MATTARRKARSYDPRRTRGALTAQTAAVLTAARGLTPGQLDAPCGLPGWDVRDLLAHLAAQIDAVPAALALPAPPPGTPVTDVTGLPASPPAPAGSAARTADPVAAVEAAAARLEPVLDEAVRADRIVPHPGGAVRALDLTVTRLLELVVHGDDLARATGVDVPPDRQALAAAVRLLADALAARAPGNSVELRVPPFAAVQAVPGPRHTRGTPPNVVETDPLTWLRVATGRESWAAACERAAISASGERADLSGFLPLLT
ncbi:MULTISPECIES: sterol carrier family protein [Streptomycetaceae]|uniref:TIGR03083 family protein n=1 Tax=Streptantibioticus cattleyicolor (strain ATCC 35852 / DSM 46488 / JCM 4925 / NBRC 14057 / NRRL 8057) TaxID=1003195 RepID=F8JVL4_STREN|nr:MULTISPECIES: sterol carrier family protein [Streptomycetaceae]AEW95713.1 hypothetical protein SCATT_33420 [Streptantibioticus cattleyicolor NRRL 8057 = DSM 46488]MYS60259.1 maleylpyruvate isomerase family mycothiol-dependent enzyme [Streptomyces sp. SID5468]CCB76052.1 conserved protein of unknown function [Streptantibioticus cattleyicolor NRRL 8057 = DSM 46488]